MNIGTIEKSSHKNFIEWYWRNRKAVIDNEVMPYQDAIFNIFSAKFKFDANKDWDRKRIKLKELWIDCANECKKIHELLHTDEYYDDSDDLMETVTNIVNMDYWSLQEFFNVLKDKYKENAKVCDYLNKISYDIWKMRAISKNHTNIIQK